MTFPVAVGLLKGQLSAIAAVTVWLVCLGPLCWCNPLSAVDQDDGEFSIVIENPLPLPQTEKRLSSEPLPENEDDDQRFMYMNRGFTSKVCYDDIGCFEYGKEFSQHKALPYSPQDLDPSFQLFVPGQDAQTIDYFNLSQSVQSLIIDSSKELFVNVHGFRDSDQAIWVQELADVVVRHHGLSLLSVGWTKGAATSNYFIAAANIRVVGAMLARVLQELHDAAHMDLGKVTIIGHSLGAHTAGFAGQRLKKLYRIVGLDPAGPLFGGDTVDPAARLDPTDADIVQAIHTNADSLTGGGFGQIHALGHVDFYVNGGWRQPGCQAGIGAALWQLATLDISNIAGDVACSHNRAQWLLIEFIRKEGKRGACLPVGFAECSADSDYVNKCFRCDTEQGCATPGLSITRDTQARGKFFFSSLAENFTTGEYCGQQYHLELKAGSKAGGSINLELHGTFGIMVTLEVQRSGDSLVANKTLTRSFMAPWGFELNKVVIKYESVSGFFRSANIRWQLDSMVIVRHDGRRYQVNAPVDIVSKTPMTMSRAKTPAKNTFRLIPETRGSRLVRR